MESTYRRTYPDDRGKALNLENDTGPPITTSIVNGKWESDLATQYPGRGNQAF